jgi:TolB-like protein
MTERIMTVFEFAGHTLDLRQGRLRNSVGDVTLRPKSLALLTYLIQHPGRVIAKDELVRAVWPDAFISDDSLSQCLKDIRAALGHEAEGIVRTVPRLGYLLDETRLRILRQQEDTPPTPAGQPQPEKPSIAVLPFETAGCDQDWFSDGIVEDITTALAKSRRLRVVSKNYSFALKGRAMRGDEIARELRVRHLLEGSVRLTGQRIRVSTRLVQAETGDLLWAERFDSDMADIFAIQDEITEAVVSRLETEAVSRGKGSHTAGPHDKRRSLSLRAAGPAVGPGADEIQPSHGATHVRQGGRARSALCAGPCKHGDL